MRNLSEKEPANAVASRAAFTRRRVGLRAGNLALSVFACSVLVSGTALGARSLDDGVYTKAQARAGKKLYEEHCLACHERGYFRGVLRTRQGETLDPLFEVMVTQMPQNDPGSLADSEYVDVIAYMLSQAKYTDGLMLLFLVPFSVSPLLVLVLSPYAPFYSYVAPVLTFIAFPYSSQSPFFYSSVPSTFSSSF